MMWLRVLILLVGICCFPIKSHAITCTATVATVAFGTVTPSSNTDVTTTGTLTYSCTKGLLEVLNTATVCFNLYPAAGTTVDTRRMSSGANTLSYQLYTDSGRSSVWGNQGLTSTSVLKASIGLLDLGLPKNISFYAIVPKGQFTTAPGSYQDLYSTSNATITAKSDPLSTDTTCGATVVGNFTFSVTSSVNKQCSINATNNVALGSVDHTRTNIMKDNFFTMTCTNTTPYTVGLSPSNNNTTGSGVMKSKSNSATNTDLVPYQLNSTAGVGGTPWGNLTANTVAGVGTGLAVNRPVYVVAPSANYRPDDYADTVTINVTY
ncbi:MAG: Csu type fimbrial protein [Kluyvera intermedia]